MAAGASAIGRGLVLVLFGLLAGACAFTGGCDDQPTAPASTKTATVKIGPTTFTLDVAADEAARQQAPMRAKIGPTEGLLLVYPAPELLRINTADSIAPVDVLFLDAAGKVVPSREEPAPGSDRKIYSNTAPAQFVIELAAGTLKGLDVKEGQAVPLDPARLIKQAKGPLETVKIGGKTFHLELAETDVKRFRGLSGRTVIEPDGGLLFAFAQSQRLEFVMRDCPIPIDIIFLDGTGRVVAMHKMTVEPQKEGESDTAYNDRLKRYSSRFAAQYAIELAGNTLDSLTLKEGDRIEIDTDRLKKLAR
jgi:uncharacterized protein